MLHSATSKGAYGYKGVGHSDPLVGDVQATTPDGLTGAGAFDFAALRSAVPAPQVQVGRTEKEPVVTGVYQSSVVCSEIRTQVLDFIMGGDAYVIIG